jgi:hypothetical protein
MEQLVVKASSSVVGRYRALLRSEWSEGTLAEVFLLLGSAISGPKRAKPHPWTTYLVTKNEHLARGPQFRDSIALIHRFSSLLRDSPFPRPPEPPDVQNEPLAWAAERAWCYLLLQDLIELKGDVGFLEDGQSLLFVCCVDYLLPSLKEGLRAHHDLLLNALNFHNFSVWRDRPAHYYYLRGLLMGYLGDIGRKIRMLRTSFLLTPAEDHSYLTKAQMLWSEMMDAEQYEEAEEFLLNVYRDSEPQQRAEVRGLLRATAESWGARREVAGQPQS